MNISIYNQEYYADPTAYNAIKNYNNEVEEMEKTKYYRGDVVDIETSAQYEKKGVVVQSFDNYVLFLQILSSRPSENPYNLYLEGGESVWVDLGKLTFCYKEKILSYYDRIETKDAIEKLTRNLANCIGINVAAAVVETVPAAPAQTIEIIDPATVDVVNRVEEEKRQLEAELIKTTAKLEVFEGLYKELLMSGGVANAK